MKPNANERSRKMWTANYPLDLIKGDSQWPCKSSSGVVDSQNQTVMGWRVEGKEIKFFSGNSSQNFSSTGRREWNRTQITITANMRCCVPGNVLRALHYLTNTVLSIT